jgi:hypothetical protein
MKKIHALTIIDKSGSMLSWRSRTIEGINSNINALKKEVDKDTEILNTQLQFSSGNNSQWYAAVNAGQSTAELEQSFVFRRVGESVVSIPDMTEADYFPDGGTPLLDAIGYGIEKVKAFHKDDLGSDDLSIIVTVFTDGEENSSRKWNKPQIKKMIEHFQSDGKWTFTFVGCGSFDAVSGTSAGLGISSANTVAYCATDSGTAEAFSKVATSYSNYARSRKLGVVDNDLFTEKVSK